MKMNFDLSMQQTQKLVMTQQLQLAIKILQMPSLELNEYIQNQLTENPVLESNTNDKPYEEIKYDWKEIARNFDYSNDYELNTSEENENVSPLNFIACVTTLRDHILFQLRLTIKSEKDMSIGEYVIENIDSSGYLRMTVNDIAAFLNITEEKVKKVLSIIQTFDPPGVGSRDIKECLIIQLHQQDIYNQLLEVVISEYLNEIGENKYNVIAKELLITVKEAQAIGDIIKGLEPKPGRGFADKEDIKYVIPDVTIEKIDNEYIVIVNERNSPKLTISSYYRDILKNDGKDSQTTDYIKRKLDSAAWLIKSIGQRNNTLHNVVKAIIAYQKDFLDKGVDYLKPLTLKEVAEDIGMHESTVSRAINGKYVQTSKGLYELKFFFTRGLDVAYGDNKSSKSMKNAIKNIINSEDSGKPLSDQKITDMFNKEGINISRRTVAKYREEVGIPPTSKRKRF